MLAPLVFIHALAGSQFVAAYSPAYPHPSSPPLSALPSEGPAELMVVEEAAGCRMNDSMMKNLRARAGC
jgi:hypothetical protein